MSDPAIFFGVLASLILVVMVASYVPARTATRIDPLVALRHVIGNRFLRLVTRPTTVNLLINVQKQLAPISRLFSYIAMNWRGNPVNRATSVKPTPPPLALRQEIG